MAKNLEFPAAGDGDSEGGGGSVGRLYRQLPLGLRLPPFDDDIGDLPPLHARSG